MIQKFTTKVGVIEGPLDLILSLIEERKMLVSDVSLASVADEFITYVRSQERFPAGEAAQFIVTAATLLLLKSKALLPVLSLSDEEEGDVRDLEYRLALYQAFRLVARRLGQEAGRGARLYFGGLRRDATPVLAPARDATPSTLHAALQRALASAPRPRQLPEVAVAAVVTLEEMMNRLSTRIEEAMTITFRDFVGTPEDRREIVVGFLAVLELIKRGLVMAEQGTHFAEITMEYRGGATTPRYE